MIVWNEHKISCKSILKYYGVLDLIILVLVLSFSIQKSSFSYFNLIFIVSMSVLVVLLICSIRVNFACLLKLWPVCLKCMDAGTCRQHTVPFTAVMALCQSLHLATPMYGYIYKYEYIYICIYICIYIYIMYTYIYIYIYIYIYKLIMVKNTTKFQVPRVSCKYFTIFSLITPFSTLLTLNRSIVHDIEHFMILSTILVKETILW